MDDQPLVKVLLDLDLHLHLGDQPLVKVLLDLDLGDQPLVKVLLEVQLESVLGLEDFLALEAALLRLILGDVVTETHKKSLHQHFRQCIFTSMEQGSLMLLILDPKITNKF